MKVAKRERLMRRVNELKSTYPLVFADFVRKHSINVSSAKNDRLDYIVSCGYNWPQEERKLKTIEDRKKAIEKSYTNIIAAFPNGLKKWNSLHPHSAKENIVSNEHQIRDYEKFFLEAQEYNTWEREQEKYRNLCYDLQKKILPNEGRYYYKIPFQKKNDEGKFIDGNFGVWQIFFASYCLESELDYTGLKYIKEETSKIGAFKQKNRFFIEPVYKRLNDFLLELSRQQPISVYLCANNKEWRKEGLFYHYFVRSLFADLPDDIEVVETVSDSLLFDDEIDYDYYPAVKNRHIVIIEMQTENDHLKEVCKKIIDKNKDKRLLITYISFLKGYDREEMIKLIDNEKKKKEKEALRKQREKEDEIISICAQYGVNGLFHMTHVSNLNSILQNGLMSHTKARKDGFMKVNIANNDVNDRRAHPEPIHNKPIHDYAPLYFNPRNPMLYVRKDQQENIVLIEFSPTVFLKDGVVFSDGNAAVHTTATYNSKTKFYSDLTDLDKLNWCCINDDYWSDYEDGKRIKCAEVLVPNVIEKSYITRIHYLKEIPQLKDLSEKYGIELKFNPELYF